MLKFQLPLSEIRKSENPTKNPTETEQNLHQENTKVKIFVQKCVSQQPLWSHGNWHPGAKYTDPAMVQNRRIPHFQLVANFQIARGSIDSWLPSMHHMLSAGPLWEQNLARTCKQLANLCRKKRGDGTKQRHGRRRSRTSWRQIQFLREMWAPGALPASWGRLQLCTLTPGISNSKRQHHRAS